MKLSLVSIEKAGYIRLAVEGEITTRSFHDPNSNPLNTVLGQNWPTNNIMLSLEKVSFIDSSAIGWLIDCQRKSKAAGGKFVLYAAPSRVRDVFDLLKMRSVLNLRDTETAAGQFLTSAEPAPTGESK